jgi:hypothetical protein
LNTDMSVRAAIGGEAADEWHGQLRNEPAGKTGWLIPELTMPFAGARSARAGRRPTICV